MRRTGPLVALIGLLALAGCSTATNGTTDEVELPMTQGLKGCTHTVESRAEACILAPACVPANARAPARSAPPKGLSEPLEARLLSRFAVFRRPRVAGDQPPASGLLAGKLNRTLSKHYELSRYYPNYVRQLRTPPGGPHYFVVPAFGRREAVPPARCLGTGERREQVKEQRRRRTEPVFCLLQMTDRRPTIALGCRPFDAIDEGGAMFDSDSFDRTPTVELVPDGVAAVRFSYRTKPPKVALVGENAFLLAPPALNEAQPTKIEWLGDSGQTIRIIPAPAANTVSPTSVGNLRAPIGG